MPRSDAITRPISPVRWRYTPGQSVRFGGERGGEHGDHAGGGDDVVAREPGGRVVNGRVRGGAAQLRVAMARGGGEQMHIGGGEVVTPASSRPGNASRP